MAGGENSVGKMGEHLRVTGGALGRWFVAQTKDALAVAALWWVGLLIIGVPWSLLWAGIGGVLQYVPNVGPLLALVPVSIVAAISGGWWMLLEVLILYAIIAVVDGFVLQPIIMKRTTRVPVWASIVFPIVMGVLFNFWGVLLSAPLLSIVYTYKYRMQAAKAERAAELEAETKP